MQAVVGVESGGISTALHVNRWNGVQPHAATAAEAIGLARHFITAGYSVDLGLGQLNSRNLARFGMTVEDAFDDCKNLTASGAILSGFYAQAVQHWGEGQRALMASLSGYNTGDLSRGFSNGYVGRYYINAQLAEPATHVIAAVKHEVAKAKPWIQTVAYDRPGYALIIQ